MKKVIKVALVIIGTIVGAGFASGKEIYLFFNRYGIKGILGLVVASILCGVIICKVFKVVRKKNIKTYEELLQNIYSNKQVSAIFSVIINIFLLLSFYIMVAGFSAYFKQALQIPTFVSSIIMAVGCYITFKKGTKGIVGINEFLIPLLIIFIIFLGIKNLNFTFQNLIECQNINIIKTNSLMNNWLVASILYVSYNSITLIPILIDLKEYMKGNKKIEITGFICTVCIFIIGICIFTVLLRGGTYIQTVDLPMVYTVQEMNKIYPYIYGIVIVAAIFTSAISAGYGFLKNVTKTKKNYNKMLIFICVSAVFVSQMGFSNLVSLLYPIFRNAWSSTNI